MPRLAPILFRLVFPVVALSAVALAQQRTLPQGAAGQGASALANSSTILGTVLTGAKQPVAGLTVRVMSRFVPPGDQAARYTTQSTVRTNARGEYRINLPAGDYIIDVPLTHTTIPASVLAASGAGESTGSRAALWQRIADSMGPPPYFAGSRLGSFAFQTMGPQGPAPGPRPMNVDDMRVYRAVIYPDVFTTQASRIITLRSGDTFRADMTLPFVRGMRVSGTLDGPPSEIAHIALRLLPVLSDTELFRDVDFEHALTVSDDRGAFTFLGVPPGQYTLKALYVPSTLQGDASSGGRSVAARVGNRGGGSPTEGAMAYARWAQSNVNVGGSDVTGLKIPLNPAIRVTGRLDAARLSPTVLDFSGARIMLLSNRPVTIAPPASVAVAADGTFTARLYGPGLYSAQVSGIPGSVAVGLSADSEAASVRWLSVPDRDVSGVIVTLAGQPLGRSGATPGATRSLPPSAPPPPPGPDNAFLAGRVIDGTTSQPIRDATVILQRSGSAADSRRVATTDAAGAFTFGDAVAGTYAVTATAAGYSASAFGRVRADGPTSTLGLAAHERVTSMAIRMWKPGAVSGRITDARGQAVAGLSLVSLRLTEFLLRRDYVLHSAARTDAAGMYRFGSLPPGDYVVCASFTPTTIPDSVHQFLRQGQAAAGRGGSAIASLLAESRAPTPGPRDVLIGSLRFFMGGPDSITPPMPAPISPEGDIRAYRSLCYPAATSLADAAVIAVQSGEDRGSTNLTLPDVSTVRVSGTVRGPRGPMPNLGVRLIRALGRHDYVIGGERLEAAVAVSDAQGAFSFLGVPAGSYLLRAWTTHVDGETPPAAPPIGRPAARSSGVTLWAEVPITVGGSSLSDLVVTMAPTARVNGRVIWDGSAPAPGPFPLALWTRQQFDPPLPPAASVNADGTFTLLGYAPGHYGLPINSVGPWRITSATLDGKSLPSHTVDLGTGDLSNLVLTATDRFTTLSGQITAMAGLGPIEAMVCIFPADYRAWSADAMTQTRIRWFRPSGRWTYTATWLPPGDYVAIVYPEADGDDLTPAFIERLAKFATPVTLTAGQRTTLDLRVVSIR